MVEDLDDRKVAWEEFQGIANTEAVLAQKASIISRLIDLALDVGIFAARTVKENGQGNEQIVLNCTIERDVMAETAAILLRWVDEVAFRNLSALNRNVLMDAVERFVSKNFEERGLSQASFAALLQARYAEYSCCKKWVAKIDESAKGTLFWEFAKKIAFLTGVGKSAIFNVMVSSLLLKQLRRWNLDVLIRGEQPVE